jgi:hypothetical protein
MMKAFHPVGYIGLKFDRIKKPTAIATRFCRPRGKYAHLL